MPVSQAVCFKPAQTDVFQVAFGVLWHKWLNQGSWKNESLSGPFSVVHPSSGVKFPDQEPQVAILGTQCVVTVEDTTGKVWYFAQDASSDAFGVNQLP